MKKILLITMVVICLFTNSVSAQTKVIKQESAVDAVKIGYIDIAKIFDEYSRTKDAKEKIDKEIDAQQVIIKKMETEVDSLRMSLDRTSDINKRKEMEYNVKRKTEELQQFIQKVEGDLSQKEAELTDEIVRKIYSVVESMGKEGKYTLIIDKNSVLYGGDGLDITGDVIEQLEKEALSEIKGK